MKIITITIHASNRTERSLLVHGIVLLCISIAKMNGQGGEDCNALVDLHQLGTDTTIFLHLWMKRLTTSNHDATRQSQVPIQPRTPDAASVGFDTELAVSVRFNLGNGLQLQIGRVRMSGDD